MFCGVATGSSASSSSMNRSRRPRAAASQSPSTVAPRSDEQSGHVPAAAVTNRVRERSADRTVGHIDVRPSVDEDGGHGGIVTARRPVQGSFAVLVVAVGVDISPRVDEQLGRLWPVREEAGPVGDDVERRAAPGGAPKTRGCETRLLLHELA